jgi:hypothetical protein
MWTETTGNDNRDCFQQQLKRQVKMMEKLQVDYLKYILEY